MHIVDWLIMILPLVICAAIALYSRRYVRRLYAVEKQQCQKTFNQDIAGRYLAVCRDESLGSDKWHYGSDWSGCHT